MKVQVTLCDYCEVRIVDELHDLHKVTIKFPSGRTVAMDVCPGCIKHGMDLTEGKRQ